MTLVGLRTVNARHIEDRVHAFAERARLECGDKIPLCAIYLPRETKRQKMEKFAPAVICPFCIARARDWYAASYFITFDSVQRRRLLDALTWDLEHV